MLPIGSVDILANFLPTRGYICVMVTAKALARDLARDLDRLYRLIVAWIPEANFGVRVKFT